MMSMSPRVRAILQALLVTFLWSTSWILIKFSLNDIPPLTFAGLRYALAFFILLPGLWKHKHVVATLSSKEWQRLSVLGLVFYTLTQGGQFLTLKHLEAVTFSLLLNFSSLFVAIFGIFALREVPSRLQWGGLSLFLVGVLLYFFPISGTGAQGFGFACAGFTVCANAVASVLGRAINQEKTLPPLVVTAVSMGIGAVLLLSIGLVTQGLPAIGPGGWATIVWLAAVNTALAFTLWNKSLQHLSAMESSIINNTMLVQIAALAYLFLGERLATGDVLGLLLATLGILMVQVKTA